MNGAYDGRTDRRRAHAGVQTPRGRHRALTQDRREGMLKAYGPGLAMHLEYERASAEGRRE